MNSIVKALSEHNQSASWFSYNHDGTLPDINNHFVPNTNYVFIGLNPGSVPEKNRIRNPWWQWHDHGRGWRRLLKLYEDCPQLKNAYMTDIFKVPFESHSEIIIRKYLRKKVTNPKDKKTIESAIDTLTKELSVLNSPKVIAFGSAASDFMATHFKKSSITKIPHYCARISNEDWFNKTELAINNSTRF